MDFETLKKYKELLIENYDYSQQSDGMVWFHGVQLKDIPEVPFHFADDVLFEYTDVELKVTIHRSKDEEPIIIENLI